LVRERAFGQCTYQSQSPSKAWSNPASRGYALADEFTRDVADSTPGAEVKAIDVSPIQPSWIPPNVRFEIDDYNQDWGYENRFDLIHTREILGTVPDWPEFFRKAYRLA
jgi:hypothetical protein